MTAISTNTSPESGKVGTPYVILDSRQAGGYARSRARLARVVVPRLPQHITQRGNRRQQTFFCARAHMQVRDDRLVKLMPLLERVGDWGKFPSGGEAVAPGTARSAAGVEAETMDEFRPHEYTGSPLGSEGFVSGCWAAS